MALTDRKVPILAGINDTPSTTGQPNHPNASLLCKNYNDLIDSELIALDTAVTTLQTTVDNLGDNLGGGNSIPTTNSAPSLTIYVNSTTGNDANDGSELLPYLTIQKAIDHYTDLGVLCLCDIVCTGTFINPELNFSKIYTVCNAWFGDWQDDIFNAQGFRNALSLTIRGIDFNTRPTLRFTNSNVNGQSTGKYSFIVGANNNVFFNNIIFELGGTDHKLHNQSIVFNGCAFINITPDIYNTALLQLIGGNVIFKECSFNIPNTDNQWFVFHALKTHVYVMQSSIDSLNIGAIAWFNAQYCFVYYDVDILYRTTWNRIIYSTIITSETVANVGRLSNRGFSNLVKFHAGGVQ